MLKCECSEVCLALGCTAIPQADPGLNYNYSLFMWLIKNCGQSWPVVAHGFSPALEGLARQILSSRTDRATERNPESKEKTKQANKKLFRYSSEEPNGRFLFVWDTLKMLTLHVSIVSVLRQVSVSMFRVACNLTVFLVLLLFAASECCNYGFCFFLNMYLFLCAWIFACMYVCISRACLVPMGARSDP